MRGFIKERYAIIFILLLSRANNSNHWGRVPAQLSARGSIRLDIKIRSVETRVMPSLPTDSVSAYI